MLKWFKEFFYKMSPQRWIFVYYLLALFIATIFLSFPLFYRGIKDIQLIDTVFVAASALSVTGLTPVSISETFNGGGYIVIMLIMNLGGIGIMALGTLIWVFFGRRIGLRERMQIMVDNNQVKMAGAVKLVVEIFKTLIFIEVVGAFIYVIYFMNISGDIGYSLMTGIFLSVSATTNAGMALFDNSLIEYTESYFLQFVVMLQIMSGAIGFPVLIELREYFSRRQKKFRFSLFTKVTTSTYGLLLAVGTFFIFVMESQNYFQNDSWFKTLSNSFFASSTTRSGGLTTVDPAFFADGTQVVMSGLMFIGASPSSAGGGIRTTTFALLILFLIAFSRGRERVNVFNREIAQEDMRRAFAVVSLAVLLVFSGIVSIVVIEDSRFDLIDVIFEVTSAFGTCGLSTGITDDLSAPSKVIIMMFMFIGRIGFISFLFSIGGRQHELPYHYPKERILIG
ncbi:TrkH family potassium uptake protein [Salinicoccus halodurans]|uniref:ATP synthase n=1 Tax=Salinicoccus halodurans TaxID=407035 RepID=A0A0F7HK26_9STAP|nr:TrkH family potassium uptake protein [Salinicoccus halodurans]AKG73387.1 ATP synthase [Salinicoccus halodurans]SFK81490.1 Trk-type K+ transport system, membrane component [Salinicoccus halodurans]